MIIRHDVDDRNYLELGERHAPSLIYLEGCAGTLLHEHWVLTAAHCVSNRKNALLAVRHLDREYRVEAITVHPGYGKDGSGRYDIALIQLKEPIENGRPARLYRGDDERGQPVVFVGRGVFGDGRTGPVRHDGKQRGATNTVISASTHLLGFEFDSPETATALEGISGPGDSGGPAFIVRDEQLYVAGVSSHQERNGFEKGTYGVSEYYTRVSAHVSDIEHVVANAAAPVTIDHPVIDAIRDDSLQRLETAAHGDVLEDEVVMNEAFYQTVALNRPSLAAALLARGVDARSVTIDGSSLYEFALRCGRKDYFDTVMGECRHSTDVHDERSDIVPLLVATLGDDPRLMDRIGVVLDQGANIDARAPGGDTALILAGWDTGNVDLVRYLIERGADVNLANDLGDTPLIDAAYLGRSEILVCLLESGADRSSRNKAGHSALDRARSQGNTEAMDLLRSATR